MCESTSRNFQPGKALVGAVSVIVKTSRLVSSSSVHTTHYTSPPLTHQHSTNSFCFWRLGPCQHSAACDTQPSLANCGCLRKLGVYCELQLTQCCPGYSVTVGVVLRCRLRGDCTLCTPQWTLRSDSGLGAGPRTFAVSLSTDHINIIISLQYE